MYFNINESLFFSILVSIMWLYQRWCTQIGCYGYRRPPRLRVDHLHNLGIQRVLIANL